MLRSHRLESHTSRCDALFRRGTWRALLIASSLGLGVFSCGTIGIDLEQEPPTTEPELDAKDSFIDDGGDVSKQRPKADDDDVDGFGGSKGSEDGDGALDNGTSSSDDGSGGDGSGGDGSGGDGSGGDGSGGDGSGGDGSGGDGSGGDGSGGDGSGGLSTSGGASSSGGASPVDDPEQICSGPCECEVGDDCKFSCTEQSNSCRTDCASQSTCALRVGNTTKLRVACAEEATCVNWGVTADKVEFECGGAGTCQASCGDAESCALQCHGTGECLLDCGSATDCVMECFDDTSCRILGEGDFTCEAGVEESCVDGQQCNGSCDTDSSLP